MDLLGNCMQTKKTGGIFQQKCSDTFDKNKLVPRLKALLHYATCLATCPTILLQHKLQVNIFYVLRSVLPLLQLVSHAIFLLSSKKTLCLKIYLCLY